MYHPQLLKEGKKLTGYRFCQQSVENFSIAEIENEQNFKLKK